jgi:hypothetical protein
VYDFPVTNAAQSVLEAYGALPEPEREEVLETPLREVLASPYEAANDGELLHAADEVFLALDRREGGA